MGWVRFHEELCSDEKAGLPRSARFVFMELSLRSRRLRGVVVLPQNVEDVAAVQMIMQGNRREVAEAVRVLSAGADPLIRFENRDGKRVLIVLSFEKWNPPSDDSKDRVRLYRENKRGRVSNGDGNTLHPVTVTDGNARARALLSSPLSAVGIVEGESEGNENGSDVRLAVAESLPERYIDPSDKLTDELRATAQLATVQDIDGAWLKFTGHYAGKWHHVSGKWQQWCVEEAKRERTQRDRAQSNVQPAPIKRAWK